MIFLRVVKGEAGMTKLKDTCSELSDVPKVQFVSFVSVICTVLMVKPDVSFVMPFRLFLIILILSTGFDLQVSGQSRVISDRSLAEKVYLQTDGEVYTTDQTIWYKAVVVNATNHKPTPLSGVLYVELIGADGQIRNRKVVKVKDGTGTGFFELNSSYLSGQYQLRAYSEWNKNFGSDFIFGKYLKIYSESDEILQDPIGSVNLLQNSQGYNLEISLRPSLLDSLHQSELLCYLSFDNMKDSLSLKPSAEGEYKLNYKLPENTDLLSLSIRSSNGKQYSKTILTNPDAIDLQFFPESGDLVHGLISKVGFKAVSMAGTGLEIAGDIMDQQNRIVTSFKANKLGMGDFLMLADSTNRYYARITSKREEGLILKYELPKVKSQGTVLSVVNQKDKIVLRVTSNMLNGKPISVRSTSRGVRYYDAKGRINRDGQLQFAFPADELPEGIIVFTLYDQDEKPLAERLFFNQVSHKKLNIQVQTDKPYYEQREKTRVTTTVTNTRGEPVQANISYLVINRREMGLLQQERDNLVSYLLMNSELKGDIEQPGYYFQSGIDRSKDLDVLMLTQGWRQYVFIPGVKMNLAFQPEYKLTVSGTVSSLLSSKKKKSGVDLTMMAFGDNTDVYQSGTDSLGKFYFDVNDAYGEQLNVVIQSANVRGKNKNYQLKLDQKTVPEIGYDPKKSVIAVDSVVSGLVNKHRERKLIEDAYRPESDVRDLGEFVVEDYAMTPEREKVVKLHGMPDVVIDGDDIRKETKKWSYGLYSVFRFTFDKEIEIRTEYFNGAGFEYANVIGANVTLITIDGVPVELDEYPFLPFIPVNEVKSFEIMKSPKNFPRLFYEVYPSTVNLPFYPAIIAIYTHGGKGFPGARKAEGIYQGAIEVFSPPREFYKPKYETLSNQDWLKPDYRALLHWQPNVMTDTHGNAETSFYNADHEGEMMIVVEAIAEDGSIGYREVTYNVKKRTDRH